MRQAEQKNGGKIKIMGTCENCAKRAVCKKEIGIIFGGCNIDYSPANSGEEKREETKR